MNAVDPWGNPYPISKFEPVSITWDYVNEVVVEKNHFSLFSTTWEFLYSPQDPFAISEWKVCRCPGDESWVHESDVPEMVRMALLVCT
jgi:hypothetical protein